MAFDGIITNAVVQELQTKLLACRVEKIYMPTKNELIFVFHAHRETIKLLISVDASHARFHITKQTKENPNQAPQFCMVLRKYLQGAKLIAIQQFGLDRVVSFQFEAINELGDCVTYELYVELMGKYSNVILVNSNHKILDSIRHVDFTMSSVREVLPARDYLLPSTLDKNEFLGMNYEQFVANLQVASMDPYFSLEHMPKIIANQFVGFSKTFVQALLDECDITDHFSSAQLHHLYETIHLVLHQIHEGMATLTNYENDYHVALPSKNPSVGSSSVSEFLDGFYAQKEANQALKTAKFNLEKEVLTFRCKYEKNLKRVTEILEDAYEMEKYQRYGELLSANLYRISPGMKSVTLENYYQNNQPITIPLQENWSPSRNAQAYFKKYRKLKHAIAYASEQQKEYETHIDYLEDVLFLISEASSLAEVEQLKLELAQAGYLKMASWKKKYHDEVAAAPYTYTCEGITILVGRNNLQNDRLTLKEAKKTETWLHTKDIHGSHVIIKSDSVPNTVLEYAAKLAVKHSQAKHSSKVPVDYTLVKYVHKPNGAKPGKVIYTNQKTIYVE